MRIRARLALVALSLGLVGSVGADPAADQRELVAPYLRALEAGAVGEIEGRAYAESRRPGDPSVPYRDVSVRAFPYTAAFEARLDSIKRQQRGSMASYTETAADLKAAQESYERDLSVAGAGDLIRGAVSDAEGVLRLSAVPVGEWLVLGWREEAHPVKAARTPTRDAGRFAEPLMTTGYAAVSYWRTRVVVRPGEKARIALSDRGVWLTAVREEFAGAREAPLRPGGSGRRR